MATGGLTAGMAARRSAICAATAALSDLSSALFEVAGGDLATVLGEVDALAALAVAARVAVTAEAVGRGEVSSSQSGSVTAWVAEHAPTLAGGGAGVVAKTIEVCRAPRVSRLREAVLAGSVAPGVALAVAAELDRLRPHLADGVDDTVLSAMLAVAGPHGARAVRELRQRLVATYGVDGQFQRDQDAAARQVALSQPVVEGDLATYQLILDPEGRAVLEAAIGPLSKPCPLPDGARDPRSAGQRRGQALVEVCRRATAAGTTIGPGVKACLFVTMSYDDLRERTGAATTVGGVDQSSLLAPETVRRLACDAGVIPVVLGSVGEVLDVGVQERLFTQGQNKALWLRDRHCTFPGCAMPAHWCQAHHVQHWADGGRTDLGNAALLCGRHHTVVHRDRLTARVTGAGVEWDTTPGSYDRDLAASPRGPSRQTGAQPGAPPGGPQGGHRVSGLGCDPRGERPGV